MTKKEIKVDWFEAFVFINVILIALLLAVLMYLHRIYVVLKLIELPLPSIIPSDARKLREIGSGDELENMTIKEPPKM